MSKSPILNLPGILMLVAVILQRMKMTDCQSEIFKLSQKLDEARFQLNIEWNTAQFIKEVFVADAQTECSTQQKDSHQLFTYDWPGLMAYYYDYTNDNKKTFQRTYKTGKSHQENDMADTGFPMIQSSNFGGKKICAISYNVSYGQTTSVPLNGKCPDGFTKCTGSSQISQKNQLCFPKEYLANGLEEDCPITSIHFVKKTKPAEEGFQYVDFDDKFKIGYSKSYNDLPLTQFQVQMDKPCVNSQTGPWKAKDYIHHYNEYEVPDEPVQELDQQTIEFDNKNWKQNCKTMASGNAQSDRYTDVLDDDLVFDLKSIEQENGISKILKEHTPDFSNRDINDLKASTKLKFWTAPALKLNGICAQQSTPHDFYSRLHKQVQKLKSSMSMSSSLMTAIYIKFAISVCYLGWVAVAMGFLSKPWYCLLVNIPFALFTILFYVFLKDFEQDTLDTNQLFDHEFRTRCIEPLDVYSQSIKPIDLGKQTSLLWIYELSMMIACMIIFFVAKVVFDKGDNETLYDEREPLLP